MNAYPALFFMPHEIHIEEYFIFYGEYQVILLSWELYIFPNDRNRKNV